MDLEYTQGIRDRRTALCSDFHIAWNVTFRSAHSFIGIVSGLFLTCISPILAVSRENRVDSIACLLWLRWRWDVGFSRLNVLRFVFFSFWRALEWISSLLLLAAITGASGGAVAMKNVFRSDDIVGRSVRYYHHGDRFPGPEFSQSSRSGIIRALVGARRGVRGVVHGPFPCHVFQAR